MRLLFAATRGAGHVGLLALVRRWRPDVVLRETMEFASLAAAERLDVPHAEIACLLTAPNGHELGLEALRAELRASRPAPYLTLAPRALEAPAVPPMPVTRRFRMAAAAAEPLPEWWRGSAEPLVYVSFGSAAAGNGYFPAIYRTAAEALADAPVRVLLTLGTEVDPRDLGPVPANVHVERWVPQGKVMPHAAAMVGHGGSGSTLMAMAAGLPLAVVPLFADQPLNAARVAAAGAGLALDGADGLGEAVRTLLEDPAYANAARVVADEIAGHAPIEAVVPLLRALAAGDALAA